MREPFDTLDSDAVFLSFFFFFFDFYSSVLIDDYSIIHVRTARDVDWEELSGIRRVSSTVELASTEFMRGPSERGAHSRAIIYHRFTDGLIDNREK